MNDNIIQVKNLKKHYAGGEVKALDGVCVDIKRGEVVIEIEYPKRYVPATEAGFKAYATKTYSGNGVDIDSFQRELVRLDEMRAKGLINDQEYQQLKKHWIDRMNNKIF